MILDDIVQKKLESLKKEPYKFDYQKLFASYRGKHIKSFRNALLSPGLSIIGEIKKASPSRGLIKPDFNPVAIAKEYDGAVDCISVLTEEDFFMGSINYLKDVHSAVSLPLLRKDFIISPLQIIEAAEAGASAVLLITAILREYELREFILLTRGLGLDALVEVHNETELETAIACSADIIGINNRNLNDFSEDINTTARLRRLIPDSIAVVSESAIHTTDDIKILQAADVDAVLIGESFMKSGNIRALAREFKNAYGM